jgi:uncharacterized protein
MTQLAPVVPNERLESLDVLRGFALLGILAMNIRAMAAPFGAYMYPYALFDYDGASRAGYVFTSIVYDLKMMGLFAMLFGAGVLLYDAKSTVAGRSARGLWFRRMFWLLVIGLIHAYLIWDGDILVPYALCGLLVLWWVRRRPAWALGTGSLLVLGVGALLTVGHGLSWESMSEADRAKELAIWMPTREQAQTQLRSMLGSYFEVVAFRAPFVLLVQTLYFVAFFLWRCAGMMLLGMALYKCGFLDGRLSERTYAITTAVCIPLGLLLVWKGAVELEVVKFAMPQRTFADLWNYGGSVLASVGYAAALLLVVKRQALGAIRRSLAAVGQMALSNYLFQSIVTSVLFLGWGFGLAGRFHYGQQLIVVAAIWVIQLAISPYWLARYRFGPAEWVWRSLTYWQRQPMSRHPLDAGRLTARA